MDTQTALLTYFHTLLTNDEQLQEAFGDTVELHAVFAPPDTPMPYIVQRIDMREAEGPFPLRNGTLTIDLWSDSENASDILAIREIIVGLLDQSDFATPDVCGRIWLLDDAFIPDEPGIWHYVLLFELRIYKVTEAGIILAR